MVLPSAEVPVVGGDNMTYVYQAIRLLFQLGASIFYATTEVHGLDQFPKARVPTILCFNHGNGLSDPLVLISKTPRMVRFCAKDTLWSTPIFKYFIRNSGAVPVYRRCKGRQCTPHAIARSVLRLATASAPSDYGWVRLAPYYPCPHTPTQSSRSLLVLGAEIWLTCFDCQAGTWRRGGEAQPRGLSHRDCFSSAGRVPWVRA